MKCHRCGFSQPDDSVFCEKCGVKLDKPKTVICTICGHEQTDGAFCDICGNPINGVSVPEEEPVIVRPFADRWEEPKKDENKANPKDRVSVQRKRLIAAICFVSVCIFAAGGVFLYMKGNKDKENIKTDRIARSDSSEEDQSSDTPETATTAVTTTVTTTQTETTTVKEEPATEAISEDWVDEYIAEIESFQKEIGGDNFSSYLVDINNDDIPELFMSFGIDYSKLFTIVDGRSKLLNLGSSLNTNYFLCANYMEHTYTIRNSYDNNYTCSIIQLNDNGTTEVIEEFGCKDGYYYMGDKQSDVTSVERRINNLNRSWYQQTFILSADELKKELEKYRQQGTSAKKKVEVIPATELIDMSTSDIRELIGDDYTIYENHEYDYMGYEPTYGITNSTYFPNTYLYFYGDYTADEVKDIFEKDTPISFVQVLDGGLIGDKAKVGDTYHDMLTLVDSMSGLDSKGVNTNLGTGISIVDGHEVYMYFDHIEDLRKLATGHEVVDAYNTDAKCVKATINKEGYAHNNVRKAKVTGDGVAIRVAPYVDATALLNADKGADIYLENGNVIDVNGDKWYQVQAYYYKGVQKVGYIHAEYVKITN